MTMVREDIVERTLRWMTENLMGAYNATHPPGHPRAGKHCTNSGTCIILFCYINSLGKVLLKGGPPKRGPSRHPCPDFARFQNFLTLCMNDFLNESGAIGLQTTPRGRIGGDEWLYEVFRCGFIHGYPGANVAWSRNPRRHKYFWFDSHGRLTLNIDELVRGFERGVEQFRRLVEADKDLRTRFKEYILAE